MAGRSASWVFRSLRKHRELQGFPVGLVSFCTGFLSSVRHLLQAQGSELLPSVRFCSIRKKAKPSAPGLQEDGALEWLVTSFNNKGADCSCRKILLLDYTSTGNGRAFLVTDYLTLPRAFSTTNYTHMIKPGLN